MTISSRFIPLFLAALLGGFCHAQVAEDAPRPRPEHPGRKPPSMTLEQATEVARKALAKQGTPLRGRFVAKAEYLFDAANLFGEQAAAFGKQSCWYILLRDPAYEVIEYPVAPIRVLVFGEREVAILTPQ
jgi:hypothetical protein